jgi:hypothetical protein
MNNFIGTDTHEGGSLTPNSNQDNGVHPGRESSEMAPHAIVSYDDTPNDRDALALGRTLQDAGATLTLAYVRHATHSRPDVEELSQHEAEALLVRGALSLGDQSIPRRVVMSASTAGPRRCPWLRRGTRVLPAASPPSVSSPAPLTRPPSRPPSPSPTASTPRWSMPTAALTCSSSAPAERPASGA